MTKGRTALNRMKKWAARAPLVLAVVVAMIVPGSYGGSITPVSVDLTISPTVNLSDVYLVEGYTPTMGFANTPTLISLGSVNGGASRTFSALFDSLVSGTSIFGTPTVDYFTIIGLYDVPNGLVTIGFRNTVGQSDILNNVPFGLAVPGGLGFSGTESTLATALQNGDTATIGTVLATLINPASNFTGLGTSAAPIVIGGPPLSVTGSLTLVDFSNAALGGTASLVQSTATPESGSAILLGAGLLLVVFKRTRTRHARPMEAREQ